MRLLLVSPKFHGYSRSIAAAYERRGYEVAVFHYDERSRIHGLRHKLATELPARLGRRHVHDAAEAMTARTVRAVEDFRPERVVVVKGDVLRAEFHEALDRVSGVGRVPRLLWLYDELRRTAHTDATLAAYDALASYSPADAEALHSSRRPCALVHLAYDPAHDPEPAPRTIETVFVGARYPAREALLSHLVQSGIPVRAYGRDWSTNPLDRGRTWSWRRPDVPSGRDLGRQAAYTEMARAAATVNIHGDQDGFTMRTFEACGAGAVQLVDRSDVGAVYEPGVEVAVFDSPDALVELAQRAVGDQDWARRLRAAGRARTLAEHTFDHRVRQLEEQWA